jgi:branched-chain amino acid transport system substrate-binding protein
MKQGDDGKSLIKMLQILTAAFMLSGSSASWAEKAIKIGTLFPLTTTAGQQCRAAVETAAEIINSKYEGIDVPLADKAGLLDGYRIVLVHADHKNNPELGKSEAERLFDKEGVYALIGCYNNEVTKRASFVAERKKKIFLCGSSDAVNLTRRGFRYFFRIAATNETESAEFVEMINWLNKTENADLQTVGFIYGNDGFGKNAAEEGEFKVVADIPFNPGSADIGNQVRMLMAKKPDIVFAACPGADYALWVRTMKQMNWLPKAVLNYSSGYQDALIAKELGADAEGFMGSAAYSPDVAPLMPSVKAVERIFKSKSDSAVQFDSSSIQEAVALFVLAQAIETAGDLDTEKVAEALRIHEWESPLSIGGKVAFATGGQNIRAKHVITQMQGGKYKRIYPSDLTDTSVIFPMKPWNRR